jgi:hypothetical protein
MNIETSESSRKTQYELGYLFLSEAGSHEHGNELSGFIKGGKILE